jgi:hypothetical protein
MHINIDYIQILLQTKQYSYNMNISSILIIFIIIVLQEVNYRKTYTSQKILNYTNLYFVFNLLLMFYSVTKKRVTLVSLIHQIVSPNSK